MFIINNFLFIKSATRANPCDSQTKEKLGFIKYPELNTAQSVHQDCTTSVEGPYVSPNGSIFCSKESREGILPILLKELLATRQMIKKSIKIWSRYGNSDILVRVLEARQLALKMLANVTYGYTSASFSGRMPMVRNKI